VGQDDQQRHSRRLLDQLPEQVQGRRVGPMCVFPDLEQRSPLGFLLGQRDQRIRRLLLELLRRQVEPRIAIVERQ
jgi:hypothetical protein